MTPKEHAFRICLLFRSELEYLDGTNAHKDMRAKRLAIIHLAEMSNLIEMDSKLINDIKTEIDNLKFK